jgi:phosphocarrier protein HPr
MYVETRLIVHHPEGLHARPAAVFVQTAATFRAAVQISNATNGRGPAPAKSILAVLTLGVSPGDQVLLRAEGDDAEQALQTLAALLAGEPAS